MAVKKSGLRHFNAQDKKGLIVDGIVEMVDGGDELFGDFWRGICRRRLPIVEELRTLRWAHALNLIRILP